MRVNKSFITDETGQRIAGSLRTLNEALWGFSEMAPQVRSRVEALGQTRIASGNVVEGVGIPEYVADPMTKSEYTGLDEPGWYMFVRISAKEGVTVTEDFVISGQDGIIDPADGDDHVDIAVKFEVAAQTREVTLQWSEDLEETFLFRAVDLAVRNLDYRTTFYIYDISEFASWTYALTEDETFQENKNYYVSDGQGGYTLAEVTVGEAVAANTYYNHSKLTLSGMTRNVTYRLDELVDCPIEIVLPEVPDDGYGCWYEIQMRFSGSHSITLTPTDATVKIGTSQTQGQTAGINVVDLQYTDVDGIKLWTLLNTHSNIPTT